MKFVRGKSGFEFSHFFRIAVTWSSFLMTPPLRKQVSIMLIFEEGLLGPPSTLWLPTKSFQSELKTWASIEYALGGILWTSSYYSPWWLKVASRRARKGKRVMSIPAFSCAWALLSIRFMKVLVTLVCSHSHFACWVFCLLSFLRCDAIPLLPFC